MLHNKQFKNLIYHHRLWWQFSEVYPSCSWLRLPPYLVNKSLSALLMPIVSVLQQKYAFAIVYKPNDRVSWRYTKIESEQV